jgi:UDP-N-acetylmuramate dehydrogenase
MARMIIQPRLDSLKLALGTRVRENEILGPHTTFRIGGPADLWIDARTTAELIEFVRLARENNVPSFVLGNGSNLLILDGGIRGLVIENQCNSFQLDLTNPHRAVLHVESGVPLPLVANKLARQGWSGLEWAIGVPGTMGGAIAGNAGAHGHCIADSLLAVAIVDTAGQVAKLPKTELGMAYRQSRFKHSRRETILSADFELMRANPQDCLDQMNRYTEQRRRTQPTEASVGSMFKNPPGDFAGRLIEQAGLKGTRVGEVEISPVHANFVINHGNATAREVLRLIELVQRQVRDRFGVELELEIEIVGESLSTTAFGRTD